MKVLATHLARLIVMLFRRGPQVIMIVYIYAAVKGMVLCFT